MMILYEVFLFKHILKYDNTERPLMTSKSCVEIMFHKMYETKLTKISALAVTSQLDVTAT